MERERGLLVSGCLVFICYNVRPLSQAEGYFFRGESFFKGFGGYLSIDVDLSATVRSTRGAGEYGDDRGGDHGRLLLSRSKQRRMGCVDPRKITNEAFCLAADNLINL